MKLYQNENLQIVNMKNKIILIGDLMLDIDITGTISKIAPEAPIGIIFEQSKIKKLGGAGNVYQNLLAAGVNPYFISIIGSDFNGQLLKKEIKNGYIFIDKERPTTSKTRITAYTKHIRHKSTIARIDKESIKPFTKINKLLIEDVKKEIKQAKYIIISDYNKGLITTKLLKEIKKLNPTAKFIGDSKYNFKLFKNFYIITPNYIDAKKILIKKKLNFNDIITYFKNKLNIKYPIVTLGDKGVIFNNRKNQIIQIPATKDNAIDIIGAGDVFIAHLVANLYFNKNIEKAIKIANIAAGISIKHYGTYIVKREEIDEIP